MQAGGKCKIMPKVDTANGQSVTLLETIYARDNPIC